MAVLRSFSALALLAACTRPAQGPLPGDSDASFKPSTPIAPVAINHKPPWPEYAAALAWPAANAAPFISRGHPRAGSVEIRVSPESRDAYLGLVPDTLFAEGTLLVESPAHAGTGPGFAMRKSAGKWSFYELGSQGELLSSGSLALCAGCHAEAPADGVFGLPRAPSPAR